MVPPRKKKKDSIVAMHMQCPLVPGYDTNILHVLKQCSKQVVRTRIAQHKIGRRVYRVHAKMSFQNKREGVSISTHIHAQLAKPKSSSEQCIHASHSPN